MSWFAQTTEAKEHRKKCKGCEKCIWIEESSNAMAEYGTVIEPVPERHPLYDKIKEKFGGEEID